MKDRILFSVLLILVVWTLDTGSAALADAPLKAFVSIVPQAYFVKKIGGDRVDVSVMVGPGASPATYEPKPRQMREISKAGLYFAIGVPFEKTWLKKIAAIHPAMRVVHTETGIEKRPMKAYDRHDEGNRGHHGKHRPGIKDPHVWTSPPLVMLLARNILTGLLDTDPAHEALFQANYKRFINEVVDLDAALRASFAGKRDAAFLAFHPAWGYFAEAYGLRQIPIEIEGKEPKPAQLKGLMERARAHGVKVVFVQPEFSSKSAELISREIGGKVVFLSPLARDWENNLRKAAQAFKEALW